MLHSRSGLDAGYCTPTCIGWLESSRLFEEKVVLETSYTLDELYSAVRCTEHPRNRLIDHVHPHNISAATIQQLLLLCSVFKVFPGLARQGRQNKLTKGLPAAAAGAKAVDINGTVKQSTHNFVTRSPAGEPHGEHSIPVQLHTGTQLLG